MKNKQIGRLAMRVEGSLWVAYYAAPNTMDDALFLGSIRMQFVQDSARKSGFMALMRESVSDIIEAETGTRPPLAHAGRSSCARARERRRRMTPEQIAQAALDMAAKEAVEHLSTPEDMTLAEDIQERTRAISPADVLAKVGANEPERPVKPCPDCGAQPARVWRPGGAFQMRTECACGRVTNWVMCGHDAVADSDDDTPQPAPDAVARLVEAETPQAWLDVMDERVRQVEVEGFERQYDDAYQSRDLAAAAACYAMIAGAHQREVFSAPPIGWPWPKSWWKPTDPRRDLVKAGALILAEIERLDRAACKGVRDE